MTDVRYYLINANGRILLDATTDEDAMQELDQMRTRGLAKPKQIVKSTQEILWEDK